MKRTFNSPPSPTVWDRRSYPNRLKANRERRRMQIERTDADTTNLPSHLFLLLHFFAQKRETTSWVPMDRLALLLAKQEFPLID